MLVIKDNFFITKKEMLYMTFDSQNKIGYLVLRIKLEILDVMRSITEKKKMCNLLRENKV